MIDAQKETIQAGQDYINSLFGLMRLQDLTTEEGQEQAYSFLDMARDVQRLLKSLQAKEKPNTAIWYEEMTISIVNQDRESVDVPGKAADSANGYIGLGYWERGETFHVTHLASGRNVYGKGYGEEENAQKFIAAIAPLCDWKELTISKEVAVKAKQAFYEVLYDEAASNGMGGMV